MVDQRYKAIHDSTLGIIFFGTPHRGSSVAQYGVILDRVAHSMLRKPSSKILKALEQNSDELFKLSSNFQFQLPRLQVVSFYEKKLMKGSSSVVRHIDLRPVNLTNLWLCFRSLMINLRYWECLTRKASLLTPTIRKYANSRSKMMIPTRNVISASQESCHSARKIGKRRRVGSCSLADLLF